MIKIAEPNPSYKSCDDCTHDDDSVEMCVIRRCIHAVSQLKECYVPKQPERAEPSTLYGYNIEYLALIARVLQKEGLSPERTVEALTDISRIVSIVENEFVEALRKAVEQCLST